MNRGFMSIDIFLSVVFLVGIAIPCYLTYRKLQKEEVAGEKMSQEEIKEMIREIKRARVARSDKRR
jgi:uncharacterized protein YneF (UPF0154 family)